MCSLCSLSCLSSSSLCSLCSISCLASSSLKIVDASSIFLCVSALVGSVVTGVAAAVSVDVAAAVAAVVAAAVAVPAAAAASSAMPSLSRALVLGAGSVLPDCGVLLSCLGLKISWSKR